MVEDKSDVKWEIERDAPDKQKIDLHKLTYYFKTLRISPIIFIKFKGPFVFLKEIKNGKISFKKAEEEQNEFKSNLSVITSGNPKCKEKYQLDTIRNVKNLYDSRQKIIDLLNDGATIRSEPTHKKKQYETGIKILTPVLHK